MPFNGVGVFTLVPNSWNPAVSGATIESSSNNATMNDFAAGFTACVTRDGQSPMTGNLPMGANKISGMADGTVATDAASFGQAAHIAGGNTFSGTQTFGDAVVLSGSVSFLGTVIFSGGLSVETLSVASTASMTVARIPTASVGSLNATTVHAVSGTVANLTVTSGIVVGAASGGNKGAGTINVASAIFINGTSISTTGKVIGLYSGTYSTNTDLTANIPTASTPASGDGTQIINIASVVTTTATQKVRIWFSGTSGIVAAAGLIVPTVAVFRGTTFVAAESGNSIGGAAGSNVIGSLTLNADDSPAAAGTFAYSARVGLDTGTMRMNGSVSAAFSGRSTNMLIMVFEP